MAKEPNGKNSELIEIDVSLVQPWHEFLTQEEPFDYPFAAKYNKGCKKLTYIASLYIDEENSKTFRIVKKYIENNLNCFLILEGFNFSLGESPNQMIKWAKSQGVDGKYEGFETAYAIKEAIKNNVQFSGSGPEVNFILGEANKQGFNASDVLLLQSTRNCTKLII